MTGWAEWLLAQGDVDAQMVAEAERVLEAAALRPGDTVLDVGAGLGLLTLAALERIGDGWVIAVDSSVGALEELLHLAHEANANGIMYLVGDAEVLPLPDASIDAAVLRSVLVHVADVDAAVGELARVLRPAGRLSLREPLNRSGTYLSTAVDWSPLQRLDADALAGAFEAAGFAELRFSVEDPGDEWLVTGESVDARLDARGGPDSPTLRERWQAAFAPDELNALVGHLRGLVGQTLTFRRPQLYLSARRS